MREYTLILKGKRIPVTYEVYKAYYQEYGTATHLWYLFRRKDRKTVSQADANIRFSSRPSET